MLHLQHARRKLWELGFVSVKQAHPASPQFPSPLANPGVEIFAHAIGHQEFRVLWPAVIFLCQADFLFAKWLAVGGARVLLIRSSVSDMAVDNNQRGPIFRAQKGGVGA